MRRPAFVAVHVCARLAIVCRRDGGLLCCTALHEPVVGFTAKSERSSELSAAVRLAGAFDPKRSTPHFAVTHK